MYILNLSITVIYSFDANVVNVAKTISPGNRSEVEITSVIDRYLRVGVPTIKRLSKGSVCLDTGSPETISYFMECVKNSEEKTSSNIACLEEVSLEPRWINNNQSRLEIEQYKTNAYAKYLRRLIF